MQQLATQVDRTGALGAGPALCCLAHCCLAHSQTASTWLTSLRCDEIMPQIIQLEFMSNESARTPCAASSRAVPMQLCSPPPSVAHGCTVTTVTDFAS